MKIRFEIDTGLLNKLCEKIRNESDLSERMRVSNETIMSWTCHSIAKQGGFEVFRGTEKYGRYYSLTLGKTKKSWLATDRDFYGDFYMSFSHASSKEQRSATAMWDGLPTVATVISSFFKAFED